jgi:hypothetical protein
MGSTELGWIDFISGSQLPRLVKATIATGVLPNVLAATYCNADSTERDRTRHRETLQFIRWRAATISRTMRRLALRNDAVESRAGGRRERLAGGA